MNLFILTGLSITAAAGLFAFLIVKLTFRARSEGFQEESWRDFSIEDYRPMERLLNEADYVFLKQQPGFEPSIAQELRTERLKIFRVYLREMVGDFNSLIRLAKLLLVHGAQDRPDFAVAISRLQYEFYWNVLMTELQLTLAPWLRVRTSASNLIGLLDRMRVNVLASSVDAGPAGLTTFSANS